MTNCQRVTLAAAFLIATVGVGMIGGARAGPFAASAGAKVTMPIPAEWDGIWSVHVSTYDCNDALLFSTTALDTICPDSEFPAPGSGAIPITCNVTADATNYTVHCDGYVDVMDGCLGTFVSDATGVRSGDSFSATTITTFAYIGECLGIQGNCRRVTQTGTRIAGVPMPCHRTPITAQSWGDLKARYR